MSEYIVVQVDMNSLNAIQASLEEMGYVYEVHEEPQFLYGYGGDKRQQKAHIIVRREHVGIASNDVGFLRKSDGSYELIISEFDKSGNKPQALNFIEKLPQLYGKHVSLGKIKRLGLKMISQTIENDQIKIKARL